MRFLHATGTALAAVLLITGCSGSKSFSKKGEKLDEAGLYAEAADMYFQSLQRNRKNVDAIAGLKKTGQRVLDDKLSEFFKANSMGAAKGTAVEAFLTAQAYADRAQMLGVTLEIPDHYKTDYAQVKGEYLVELYTEGQDLMAKQDFKAAEVVFAKIAALEPNYKDANSLQSIAYVEPLYRSGKASLDAGKYRAAYADLDKVVAKDAAYKDAAVLRQETLDKGRYSVAVVPFTSTAQQRKDLATVVQAYAITALTESNDPFLKVVDRENIDRILAEQRLGMSGVVDEATASERRQAHRRTGRAHGHGDGLPRRTRCPAEEHQERVRELSREGAERRDQRVPLRHQVQAGPVHRVPPGEQGLRFLFLQAGQYGDR
jgi:tetratricopeptide (TPR) repeat protein